jgi:hypothetical protein
MGVNIFPLLMGFMLLAMGVWGPQLAARLDLKEESMLVRDRRLKLSTRRRTQFIRLALVLMGVGLGLTGFRLSGTPATISLIVSVALMLVGLVAITVVMLVAIGQTRRR